MMRYGNRKIKVKKADLLAKIKENKIAHIASYKEAVISYKEEALLRLEELKKRAENGDMDLSLNLVRPINNSENYDKIIQMFEWEVEDIVELEQKEFVEYVQDETDFALQAKVSNNYYLRS